MITVPGAVPVIGVHRVKSRCWDCDCSVALNPGRIIRSPRPRLIRVEREVHDMLPVARRDGKVDDELRIFRGRDTISVEDDELVCCWC